MKFYLLTLVFVVLGSAAAQVSITKVFLLKNIEDLSGPTPMLTRDGQKRAWSLVHIKNIFRAQISRIYKTLSKGADLVQAL